MRKQLPEKDRLLIVKCPDWNEEGHQICKFDGRDFYYSGQPNDYFSCYVEDWEYLDKFFY